MIHVGTSGWVYADWRARFYPPDLPQSRWLGYLSERFSTVEINNSFYRLPSDDAFRNWKRSSSDGFVFAVKASRFITHIKRLRDPAEPLKLFWSRARRLGDKLGPVLFQLPPRFPADPERLRTLVRALPAGMQAAFEFRDRSWERADVFELLDGAGAAFVYADRPGARIPEIITGDWAYIRFHQGAGARADYRRAKLARWAARIDGLSAREIWIYFNNDSGGAALRDAATLIDLLAGRGRRVA